MDPAVSSSGLLVEVLSTTPSICSINAYELAAILPGICVLKATQRGNDRYAAAPDLLVNITIVKRQQAWGSYLMDQIIGEPDKIHLKTSNAGVPVKFVNNTPDICTIINGIQRAISIGNCSVTIEIPENDIYQGSTATFTSKITIQNKITSVKFPGFYERKYFVLNGTVTNLAGGAMKFYASPKTVCFVQENYLVAVTQGSCKIEFWVNETTDGYTNGLSTYSSQVVTIGVPPMELLSSNRIVTSISSNVLPNAVIATIVPGTFHTGATGLAAVGQSKNLTTSWIQCAPGFVPEKDVAPSIQCRGLSRALWAPKASYVAGSYGYENYTSGVEGLLEGYIPVAMGVGQGDRLGQTMKIYDYVVWDYPKS